MLGAGVALSMAQAGSAAPPGHTTSATGATVVTGQQTQTAGRHTVTLLTGDRVTVTSTDAGGGLVVPAKGREHLRFLTIHERGDLYVIPQDALPLLRDKKLDRRLFDVSALIRFGYDDARRDTLPLIVAYQQGAVRPNAAISGAGARVTRNLPDVGGAALVAPKARASAAWSALTSGTATTRSATAAGIARIWLDGKRSPALDQSVPQIGAPTAWQAGYTGKGVSVAVIDTGIDATHPDLAGKVVAAQNFTEAKDATDTVGHGTHVASTIAGTGAASGGKYKGVAPDATLLSGKVCEDAGCTESAILAGMQWAAADRHAKVANLSLGGQDTPDIDPLEQAVNTLTAQYGTLFVIAAGNEGPQSGTIGSPGSADAALTVGAVDKSDQLAEFSSRGPRVGDDAVKPDITAPGVKIVAAKAAGTDIGTPVGDSYVTLSGTSMATPHVAGSVAILAQEHPDWSAAQYKATLMASAKPNPALSAFQQGAGRVDVARAIGQAVTSDPVSISYGRQLWPHADDKPITKTVTYHNGGTAAVTLDLAVHVVGPTGASVPAGLFTLSATRVTVPAGGQAQVDVTANTSVGGPDGLYSGELLATGDKVQVSTALGVNKEVESYNLTVNFRDRKGALTGDADSFLVGTDNQLSFFLGDPSGTVKVRIPKGHYDLSGFLYPLTGVNDKQRDQIMMAQPVVALTGDLTIDLDGRTAKPVTSTVPRPEAKPVLVYLGYTHTLANGTSYGSGMITDTFTGLYTRQQGPAVPKSEKLTGVVSSQWARPDDKGGFTNSPYEYAVQSRTAGLPTGYTRHYRPGELAVTVSEHAPVEPGDSGAVYTMPINDDGGWAAMLPVPLPSTLTRYLSTADNQKWMSELDYGRPTPDGYLDLRAILSGTATYRAGQHVREQWNQAPFGPAFPTPPFSGYYITRRNDTLTVAPPIFSDGAGHEGGSVTDKASIKLYRDGTLIAEAPDAGARFEVPAAAATYRVEVAATRSGFSGLSSTVTASWTFRSAHVSTVDTFVPQSAFAVRFTPRLNAANQARAGLFEVPISVQVQPGATVNKLRLTTVEASFNDGATWQRVPVFPRPGGWVALLKQPASGFVSLRASATDAAGDRVEQTIIHAYGLTGH